MAAWARLLLRLAIGVLAFVRQEREKRRTAAVRADPAGEWLRKFGGTDQRAPSGPDDAGGDRNG